MGLSNCIRFVYLSLGSFPSGYLFCPILMYYFWFLILLYFSIICLLYNEGQKGGESVWEGSWGRTKSKVGGTIVRIYYVVGKKIHFQ